MNKTQQKAMPTAQATMAPSMVGKGAPTTAPSRVGKGAPTTMGLAKSTTTTYSISKQEESTNMAGKIPAEQQQQAAGTGNQGQGDAKPKQKRNSFKGKRKGKPGKIHIRLPPIEAYQKDLCFAAEAPGRVVVRLERLMGSDKIRPVDGKFMETLIQRLEEEEKIAWDRKIKLRKKAEKDRHRQLAISGLMEPGPGMEDLYDHPVFRVNRILNRLSSLDSTFSNNPALKLPPIVPINPFETDESGAIFKEYPKHRALRKEWEKHKDKYPQPSIAEEEEIIVQDTKSNVTPATKGEQSQAVVASKSAKPGKSKVVISEKSKLSTGAPSKVSTAAKSKSAVPSKASAPLASTASVPVTSPPSDIEEEDEYDEELLEEDLIPPTPSAEESATELEESEATEELTELEQISQQFDKEYTQSLAALQDKYGVPKSAGFEEEWKPYRSELVEKLFNDFETTDEMFEAARNLFDVYTRQDMLTQEHLKKDRTKSAPSKVQSGSKRQVQVSESTLENKASQPASSARSLKEPELLEETEDEEESGSDEPDLTDGIENVNEEDEMVEESEETDQILAQTDEEEIQEEE